MAADLIRALLAALAAGVAPGYFWAAVLRPASGLAERLTYSAAISMASVPAIAGILVRHDVRYVVLYRFGQGADLAGFAADPSRYRPVFENASVIIYAAARTPCTPG